MTRPEIAAQVVGVIIVLVNIYGGTLNKRKGILFANSICNGLCSLQYLLLGAYTGVICTTLTLLRNFIFGKFKKNVPLLIVILYIGLLVGVNLYFVKNVFDIFPILNVAIYSLAISRNNIYNIKKSMVIVGILGAIYDIKEKAFTGLILNISDFVNGTIGVIRLKKEKKKKKENILKEKNRDDFMFDRLIKLIGVDNFNKIQNKKVLLIGVGGVGSYALEALVRNGFNNVTVIDFDVIDITNLNRQLITNSENIGNIKVDEAIKRAKLINKDINIIGINRKLDESNLIDILNNNYDYIIDACDDVSVKFKLMELSLKFDYKLISSMGTAKKNDPTKLKITTLDKTNYDPLAKILRKKVKDAKINKKLYVVSSDEAPVDVKELASSNLVPSVAGLLCVSYIYNDIIKEN